MAELEVQTLDPEWSVWAKCVEDRCKTVYHACCDEHLRSTAAEHMAEKHPYQEQMAARIKREPQDMPPLRSVWLSKSTAGDGLIITSWIGTRGTVPGGRVGIRPFSTVNGKRVYDPLTWLNVEQVRKYFTQQDM